MRTGGVWVRAWLLGNGAALGHSWEGFGGWLHLSGNSAGDLQVELPVLGLPILDLPILFFFFF